MVLPTPAEGQRPESGRVHVFDIPPGPVSGALVLLGIQAGIGVATADTSLARRRLTRPIRGRMTTARAFARLLAGTDMRAVAVMAGLYRIERRSPPPRLRPAPPLRAEPAPRSPVTDLPPEIVVTASKRDIPLSDYPGSAHVVREADIALAAGGHQDTRALVAQLPMLATTSLGPGREKLFIRGIADSSFAGGSQATVGQYLGEVQLNYSAPDPNLVLLDIAKVELLEGPQGTLHGSGALGGVMRVIPNPPALGTWAGELGTGVSTIAHGRQGGSVMGVANVPVSDWGAIRLVGYGSRTPGYIDDTQRDLRDINRSDLKGARGALRIRPDRHWTIDLGHVYQRIDNRDGQYVDAGAPRLTRRSAVAQPSLNNFAMTFLTVTRDWREGQSLTATVSLLNNELSAVYDATGSGTAPSSIETISTAHVLTGEIRFTRRHAGGTGFVLGAYGTLSDDRLIQQSTRMSETQVLRGIGNRAADVALFGEGTVRLLPGVTATAGVRATYLDLSGLTILPSGAERATAVAVPAGGDINLMPSLALHWRPSTRWSTYLRYQQGSRVGGYALDDAESGSSEDGFRIFRPDRLQMIETGALFGDAGGSFDARLAASVADWRNIQADFYDTIGPYTANIGDGIVLALEGAMGWRPGPSLRIGGALIATRSTLTSPAPAFAGEGRQPLPDTPAIAGRLTAERHWSLPDNATVLLRGTVRYVGRSWLGVGPLHMAQGDYAQADAGVAWTRGGLTLTMDVSNFLDTEGNRFSLGNPLTVRGGRQRTPLQPRTLQLKLKYAL